MAKLEIELSSEEQARLQERARREGLTFNDWARRRLLSDVLSGVPSDALPEGHEHWTLQDALDYAGPLPENLGRATALASEPTLRKFWDSPEDEAAWRDS